MARETQRAAFLKEVEGLWPAAKGSVTEVAKRCIRPSCLACRRGEKHPSFLFTYHKAGKQRCLYVPRAFVPQLRRAIANGRRLERRVAALGEALIFAHRRARTKPKAP